LYKTLKPGMTMIDVGANFGYFTLMAAKLVGPSGKVWAFEPTFHYGARLRAHLETNRMGERVQVFPLGLSEKPATVTIAIGNSSATIHPGSNHPWLGRETIVVMPLDRVTSETPLARVDLIKVDIDGHEPRFLRGAIETIQRFKPILVLEFNEEALTAGGSNVWELRSQVHALGYELRREPELEPFVSEEEFARECAQTNLSSNIWCFPKGRRPQACDNSRSG
jgi:FkbM family methyltransferase